MFPKEEGPLWTWTMETKGHWQFEIHPQVSICHRESIEGKDLISACSVMDWLIVTSNLTYLLHCVSSLVVQSLSCYVSLYFCSAYSFSIEGWVFTHPTSLQLSYFLKLKRHFSSPALLYKTQPPSVLFHSPDFCQKMQITFWWAE